MIIHRFSRGAFSGTIALSNRGPWTGWYSYTWSAAGEGGGQSGLGKTQAFAKLNEAYVNWVRKQMKSGDAKEQIKIFQGQEPAPPQS